MGWVRSRSPYIFSLVILFPIGEGEVTAKSGGANFLTHKVTPWEHGVTQSVEKKACLAS